MSYEPSQDEIDNLTKRLKAHRETLAHYLQQLAQLGSAYVPPSVANGIQEARTSIMQLKKTLREWGIEVADHPDDGGQEKRQSKRKKSVFLSYTRFDDYHDAGRLARFAYILGNTIERMSSHEIQVYHDINEHGKDLNIRRRISSSLGDTIILVPIITDNYFRSDWCRDEINIFLDRENVSQLRTIVPIYYENNQDFERAISETKQKIDVGDRIATAIASREFLDVRELSLIGLETIAAKESIDNISEHIIDIVSAFATNLGESSEHFLADVSNYDKFTEHYYSWWRSEFSRINTFGLRDVGEPPKVRDIFVNLQVYPDTLEKINPGLFGAKKSKSSYQIWHFLRMISEYDTDSNVALIILGSAGFGKTTLLQHVAITFACGEHTNQQIRHYTPFLVYLREQTSSILSDTPISLGKLLYNHYQFLQPPMNWFESKLKESRCIVLLDGMDEIPNTEDRKNVARWIDNQIRAYPRARFVISSRPGGYREASLQHPRRSILGMQPFTLEQRREFLEKWYMVDIKRSGGKASMSRRLAIKARAKAREVLSSIQSRPALDEFAGNPLLLTMIAIAAKDEGTLPDSRLELYKEFYDVLLYRRSQRKGIKEAIKSDKKDEIILALAFYMMKNKLSEISNAEALSIIEPKIRHLRLRQQDPGFDVLSYIHNTTNLLIPVGGDQWIFAHATFREYAAARVLKNLGDTIHWINLVRDSWWHETLRFYAAMGDATPIVATCLEVNTLASLVLAAMCLEDTTEISLEIEQSLKRSLSDNLDSEDLKRRNLAAEVQLTHRIKNPQIWHQLGDQLAIDLTPITFSEYQLFLNEMFSRNTYYQPQHWTTFHYPSGTSITPITGITALSALEFCDWLSKRYGANFIYRLPSRQELSEIATRRNLKHGHFSVWCKEKSEIYLSEPKPSEYNEIIHAMHKITHECSIPIPDPAFIYSDWETCKDNCRSLMFSQYELGEHPGFLKFLNLADEQVKHLLISIELLNEQIEHLLDIAGDLDSSFRDAVELELIVNKQQEYNNIELSTELDQAQNILHYLKRKLEDFLGDFLDTTDSLSKETAIVIDIFMDSILMSCGEFVDSLNRAASTSRYVNENINERLRYDVPDPTLEISSLLEDANNSIIQRGLDLRNSWRTSQCDVLLDLWNLIQSNSKSRVKVKETIARSYHAIRIIMQREIGQMSIWGGIRLVRQIKPG